MAVAMMKEGQRESLILGNGDLYGIVWEKDNGLFMRITKNDFWDAWVDTSQDGELPRVDPVTRGGTSPGRRGRSGVRHLLLIPLKKPLSYRGATR